MKATIGEFRLKLYPGNFSAVRAFYEHDLGLEVIKEWDRGDTDKGVMFKAGDATLELLSPDREPQPVIGASVSWEVPNVRELWAQWEGRPNVVFGLRDNAWGDSSFCITDPENFRITFFTKHA